MRRYLAELAVALGLLVIAWAWFVLRPIRVEVVDEPGGGWQW